MRLKILLLAMIVVATTLNADECSKCDCAHFPWKSTCKSCCSLNVLNNSSTKQLRRYLDLDDESLSKLAALKTSNKNGKITSLDELKAVVGEQKMSEIDQKIADLGENQARYLAAPQSNKKAVYVAPDKGKSKSD